jgi:hypothetical protein
MSTGGNVPELISNGNKARAWAEKIVQASQIGSSRKSRLISLKRDKPLDTRAPGSSLNTDPGPEPIYLARTINDDPEPEVQSTQARQADPESSGQIEQPAVAGVEINPFEVANKVYRLMQKDLILHIERAGK